MRLHQRARLRIDLGGEVLLERPLPCFLEDGFGHAAIDGRRRRHERGKPRAAKGERERGADASRVRVLRRQPTRGELIARKRGGRKSGEQGLIQIEESTHGRPDGPVRISWVSCSCRVIGAIEHTLLRPG